MPCGFYAERNETYVGNNRWTGGGEQGGPAVVEQLAASLATPSQLAVREEELLKFSEILLGLSSAEREAIVLRHLQGRPLRDVAERLGRSTGAVAGLLHRGLRRLKQQMHSGNSSFTPVPAPSSQRRP